MKLINMLVNPSAVSAVVLGGTLSINSAAAASAKKGNWSKEELFQKKKEASLALRLLTIEDEKGPGKRREEELAKIAALRNGTSAENVAAVDTGIIDSAVAAKAAAEAEQDVEFVECIGGYTSGGVTCKDACDGSCCVGANSCALFTGNVAKDGSCNGLYACFGSKIGLVLGGSCVGV